MTYYEPPPRRRRQQRSMLDSPWLSALLVVVVLGLIGTLYVGPRLFGSAPVPTPTRPAATLVAVATASPAGPSLEPTFARPTPSPAPTFVTYRVRSGDTLSSIAKHFHTTARSIAWWNRGTYPSLDPESSRYDPSTIRVGWKLVVIPSTVVDEENPPTPSPAPAGTQKAT